MKFLENTFSSWRRTSSSLSNATSHLFSLSQGNLSLSFRQSIFRCWAILIFHLFDCAAHSPLLKVLQRSKDGVNLSSSSKSPITWRLMSFHPLNGEGMESEKLGLRRVHLDPLDHLLTKSNLQVSERHVLYQTCQLINYQWASGVFMSCTGLLSDSFTVRISFCFPISFFQGVFLNHQLFFVGIIWRKEKRLLN